MNSCSDFLEVIAWLGAGVVAMYIIGKFWVEDEHVWETLLESPGMIVMSLVFMVFGPFMLAIAVVISAGVFVVECIAGLSRLKTSHENEVPKVLRFCLVHFAQNNWSKVM